ncbi:unnamed protein product, partial [Schistosoma curassoni]|uniref:BTB/POZ domain-containing protein n=1 Tax=Schistosoma curassoni TaxID=6186 RepID=A0A183L0R3_9TREM
FAPSKCKVLLQDWQDSNPVLTLDGEPIEVVEKFVYLGSCISTGGGVSDKINACIVKAREAYSNLGHLWRLRDVSLAVKVRIYSASVLRFHLTSPNLWLLVIIRYNWKQITVMPIFMASQLQIPIQADDINYDQHSDRLNNSLNRNNSYYLPSSIDEKIPFKMNNQISEKMNKNQNVLHEPLYSSKTGRLLPPTNDSRYTRTRNQSSVSSLAKCLMRNKLLVNY